MTDLPGPGNIRSDGGAGRRGFGGLWDLLSTIASGIGALPAIAADIAEIRADLRFIAGDRTLYPEFKGVPLASAFVLGDADNVSEPVTTQLIQVIEVIGTVVNSLNPVPIGATPLPDSAWQRLTTIANALNTTGGVRAIDTLITISGALQDTNFLPSVPYLRQLVDAVGRVSDDPAALTVKQLLKAQVDCCEGNTTPGGSLNPAPSALCISADGWSAPVRCTRFEEIPNGSGSGVYGVVFDAGLTAIGLQNQADISPTWDFPGLKSLSGDAVEVCFSWDLAPFAGTGLAYNRYNTVAASWGSGDQLAAGSVSLQPSPQAAQATIPAGQAVGLQIILDVPGVLPGLNFFVRARGAAS